MAKQITIYKGNIRKLYADEVSLQQDDVIPTVREEVLTDQGLFTYHLHKFTNLDYGCILPTEEEALDYLTGALESCKGLIYKYLLNPEVTEEEKEKFLAALKRTSSCVYAVDEEIKPSHTVSNQEFKKIKQERLRRNHF